MVTADQIKRGRYATGRMSQRRLAELLGVSLRTVQHYEGGRPIPLGVQDDLAAVLNLPAAPAPRRADSDRPLRAATDRDLLREIASRLAEYQTEALFPVSDTRNAPVLSGRDRDSDRAVGAAQDYTTSVETTALVGTRPTDSDDQGGETPRPDHAGANDNHSATAAGR